MEMVIDALCNCGNCALDRLASPVSHDRETRFRYAIRQLNHYEASVAAMAAAAAEATARRQEAIDAIEAEAAEAATEQLRLDQLFANRRWLWNLIGLDLHR